jgi:cytochrome c oxidase cbb3-type subunit 3
MKASFRLLLLALLLQAAPASAAAASDPEHEAGRNIYNFRCYFCHGYSGDARTLAASYLNPKPRDFTKIQPEQLSRSGMLHVVEHGKTGTAMAGFKSIISRTDMARVVNFVRREFMRDKAVNTRYHTRANGWPEHARNHAAFPFATGELALDTPPEQLSSVQRQGKELFLSSCISCHDRARVKDEGVIWDARAVSFPRAGYSHIDPPKVDAMTSATPYSRHEIPPKLINPSRMEARGAKLFLDNCAFCHGGDGTGKNWIGSFLEPHPRDLTGPAMQAMNRSRLKQVIRDGLPNTSMPAWKEVLSDADIKALIAYIHRAFHPVAKG